MYNRESKRPRISRNAGNRRENRINREQNPATREGNDWGSRYRRIREEYSIGEFDNNRTDHAERPERKKFVIRDLQREREMNFQDEERRNKRSDRSEYRPFQKREGGFRERGERQEGNFGERTGRQDFERRKFSEKRDDRQEQGERNHHPERDERKERFNKQERSPREYVRERRTGQNGVYSRKKQPAHHLKNENEETELRLNRYIAKGGVCSRRDADALIVGGRVKVNGEIVQQVGVKVKKTDKVEVDGKVIVPERMVYIILNKPKDYVTTMDDPLERKTVMSLIEGACEERVYPIGRLDRQTTGVLLFTNDGDLAKKLTHPKYNQKKIYHVFLDKVLRNGDLETISKGMKLEDGFVQADDIQVNADDRTQVGIEIHSGKNRIVRRIFEHLGYQILRLDRVYFAGITKKNLPRGKWRFLTPEEVNILKFY